MFEGTDKPRIESEVRRPISAIGNPRQKSRVDRYAWLLGAKVIKTNLVLRPLQPPYDWLIPSVLLGLFVTVSRPAGAF
jgi:hypothetical protein